MKMINETKYSTNYDWKQVARSTKIMESSKNLPFNKQVLNVDLSRSIF